MKKQLILALAFSINAFSFAQKKELKIIEKAVKKENFADAKAALPQVEGLLSSMDEKSKAKFYYLKGQVLYANGKGVDANLDTIIESFNKAKEGYTSEIKTLKQKMTNELLTVGNTAYEKKNYSKSSKYFENAYKVSKKDTLFLYYAASAAVSVQEYDRSLKLYEELKSLDFTGVSKEYFATEKASGKEVILAKNTRDLYVKSGTHIKPGERMTESKKPEIVKNIALIYISQGKNDKALTAIKDARVENPENVDLIVNEANIYLQLKDEDKFKELIQQAIAKDPNNAVLHYNVGVVSMNKGDAVSAQKSFEKVLEIDPTYSDAALNLSNVYIEKGNLKIKEMGELSMSKSDEIKYEKFKIEKNVLFQNGADVLINFLSKNPNAKIDILRQLKNIYAALGNTSKMKEIEAKIAARSGQ